MKTMTNEQRLALRAALARMRQLLDEGRWVRLHIAVVPRTNGAYVDLEWGDVDGDIEQVRSCTEYFDAVGNTWKAWSL